MQRYGQAGRKEEHGPDWGLLLAASREVSGPTFKFSSDPSSPRPAAGCTGQTRPRKEEGTELAWNWIYFLAAASGPPLVVYISLPASDRNSIFPSLPFLFFYPSPLHSSKNFSIFDQSDIQNVAQRQCQGPGHARKYSMPPSVNPPKKFPRSNSRGNKHRELRNTQRHRLDPQQHCQSLVDDALVLLEMAVCLVPAVWHCLWLIALLEKLFPPAM